MEPQKLVVRPGEDLISVDGKQISRSALLDQLERLVVSRHFRNSKRYPTFLRFVVEQTLAGSLESLKERNLGVEVFARPSDYDTNADPIVRVTAGEIRKRIAQYYQEAGHEHEVRIDLPLGTYVPHFTDHPPLANVVHETLAREGVAVRPVEIVATETPPPVLPVQSIPVIKKMSRFGSRWWALGLAALLVPLIVAWSLHVRKPGLGVTSLWGTVLSSQAPATIVIGVHSLDSQGNEEEVESHAMARKAEPQNMLTSMVRSDMVPISDIVSFSHVSDLLTSQTHGYTMMGAADATLEEIRKGPLILIGGLDNVWTLRLTSKLRFGFRTINGSAASAIVDHEHPDVFWRFDNMQQAINNTHDYAIVASYLDSTIDQPVVIVAGIGKTGTQVAAEFATSKQYLAEWLQQAGAGTGKNVELVLSTELLEGKTGPPRIVASTRW